MTVTASMTKNSNVTLSSCWLRSRGKVTHSHRRASPHLGFNSLLSKITSYYMTQAFEVPDEDYKACVWNLSELGIYRFSFAKAPTSLFTLVSYGNYRSFAECSREPKGEDEESE